jgi:hypothetical protein
VDNNFILQVSNAAANLNGEYLAVKFIQDFNSGEGSTVAVTVPNEADATVFTLSSAGKLTPADDTALLGSVFPGVSISFLFFQSVNPYNFVVCTVNAAQSLLCTFTNVDDPNDLERDNLKEFFIQSIFGENVIYMEDGPPANGVTLTVIAA